MTAITPDWENNTPIRHDPELNLPVPRQTLLLIEQASLMQGHYADYSCFPA